MEVVVSGVGVLCEAPSLLRWRGAGQPAIGRVASSAQSTSHQAASSIAYTQALHFNSMIFDCSILSATPRPSYPPISTARRAAAS